METYIFIFFVIYGLLLFFVVMFINFKFMRVYYRILEAILKRLEK